MKLTIIIVNFETKKFLDSCLDSVFQQKTKHDYEVILIDNASEDLKDIKKKFKKVVLLSNTVNVGFASGMNQGICMSEAEYILTLNPDVILEKDYLESCITALEHDKQLASASGKLLYYDFNKSKKTNVLDSTGLVMKKSRRVHDRGQGEKDNGQFDNKLNVWGVSAAAAFYRRSALNAVKDKHGFFDSRFFMYKEDVDLAWRLQKHGYKSFYTPKAVAYHRRGTGIVSPSSSILKKITSRKNTKSKEMRIRSYQNQILMQKKNDTILLKLKDFYILFPYWLISHLYYILFEPYIFSKNTKNHPR